MKIQEYLDGLLEAAVYGGIATEKPTEGNLSQFRTAVVKLKRTCGCHIDDSEEFKKRMPHYYQTEEMGLEYAETGRLALREVAPCCLRAILEEFLRGN